MEPSLNFLDADYKNFRRNKWITDDTEKFYLENILPNFPFGNARNSRNYPDYHGTLTSTQELNTPLLYITNLKLKTEKPKGKVFNHFKFPYHHPGAPARSLGMMAQQIGYWLGQEDVNGVYLTEDQYRKVENYWKLTEHHRPDPEEEMRGEPNPIDRENIIDAQLFDRKDAFGNHLLNHLFPTLNVGKGKYGTDPFALTWDIEKERYTYEISSDEDSSPSEVEYNE